MRENISRRSLHDLGRGNIDELNSWVKGKPWGRGTACKLDLLGMASLSLTAGCTRSIFVEKIPFVKYAEWV